MQTLAEEVIKSESELNFITAFNIRISYVRCFKNKVANNKLIYADCCTVSEKYQAYLPFDFIITFYDRNCQYLNDDQIRILMLHELLHIDIGQRGFCVKPHDVEDFDMIIKKYGLHWTEDNENDI